jgi:hypothetical protein
MPPRVRRQHLVSRFYLNGFADNGRIWRVTLPGEQQRVCSTKDVSVQRDFYNITLSDGSTTDAFEHLFADIEDTVAFACRRLTSSPPMWPAPRGPRSLTTFTAKNSWGTSPTSPR